MSSGGFPKMRGYLYVKGIRGVMWGYIGVYRGILDLGLSKIRGTFLGGPRIRIVVSRSLSNFNFGS